MESNTSGTGELLVTVTIAGETYGLPVTQVESIVRWEPLTILPRLPRFLAGIYNLRGRAVPVVDLRTRLELPADVCGPEQRIVMAQMGENLIGLIVDGVQEVLRVEVAQVEKAVPLITDCPHSDYMLGVANLPQGFVILLDVASLLSIGEQNLINSLPQEAQAA